MATSGRLQTMGADVNRATAVLIVAFLCAGDIQAQPGAMWDLEGSINVPVSDFRDHGVIGPGLSVSHFYPLGGSEISAGLALRAGANMYGPGDAIVIEIGYYGIPLTAGIRAYNASGSFYLEAGAGVEFRRVSLSFLGIPLDPDMEAGPSFLVRGGTGVYPFERFGITASFSAAGDRWWYISSGLSWRISK